MLFSPSRFSSGCLRSDCWELAEVPITPGGRRRSRPKVQPAIPRIGAPFMNDDHFPIDDRLSGKIEGASNHREAVRPV